MSGLKLFGSLSPAERLADPDKDAPPSWPLRRTRFLRKLLRFPGRASPPPRWLKVLSRGMIAADNQESANLFRKTIDEPARQVPLYGEYEVVILGGGPAGIAAAVAAARAGRRTLLIERYGFLGGMGTAAGVTNFCGLHANVFGEMHRVVRGIASDLLDRIDRLGGLNEPHLIFGKIKAQAYDTSAFKCAADAMLLAAGRAHV